MLRRVLPFTAACLLLAGTSAFGTSARRSPAWLSIESPVNPYDASTRGAVFLVHASLHGDVVPRGDLRGSAEGIVNGARQSVAIQFDDTPRAGVFGVRRQWPGEGTWVVRINLLATSAIVALDGDGNVAGVHLPTRLVSGTPIPRAIDAHEVDSLLADAARRSDHR